jgi:NAD(P)-dependent dehydrogenase (short-subunit alcohol dehydrogenase family)
VSLAGKAVLVTGGSRGIGRACVLGFARAGANVAIAYSNDARAADAVRAEAVSLGSRATVVQADLASVDAPAALVEHAVTELGGLDVMVCNAAVYEDGRVETVTAETYDTVLGINTRSSLFLTQAAAESMVARGAGGAIIHVLSAALARAETGNGLYRMSKAAQLMLVEAAAYELATRGVRVNAVAPGLTDTDMSRGDLEHPERRATALSAVPMGRPASPEEIAEVVLFLAGDGASYVTGSVIWADGGRHLGPAPAVTS